MFATQVMWLKYSVKTVENAPQGLLKEDDDFD